jgi:hypothetical protein
MTSGQLPAEIFPAGRLSTVAEFHRLADVPPEVEWFANLSNPSTRRAMKTPSGILCASPASPGRRNFAP